MADEKKKREKGRSSGRIDYFDTFERMADLAVAEAEFLVATMHSFNPDAMEECIARAHEIESSSDDLVDAMVVAVDADFVTPIDRDNIVELAIAIDEITDEIEKAVKHLFMYDVTTLEPAAVQMCELIRDECLIVQEAMTFFRDFKKPKKLKKRAERIDELEDEVDQLYFHAVRDLFAGDHDATHVIKWRALYSTIEECSDNIERAVDIMARVVVNNN